MNTTNRGVNRVVLFIAGVALVGVGGAAVAAMLWPVASGQWTTLMSTGVDWLTTTHRATRVSEGSPVSWLSLAALVLLALVVTIAVVIMARLGGGRSGVMAREEVGEGAQGSVTIRHGFAADAIRQSLASHDEILATKVTARRLWGTDVLQVSVTPRQNVSPTEVADTVSGRLDRLAALLGSDVTALVTIHAGIRSRFAADQSRVN